MRALVFADGDSPSRELLQELLPGVALTVAADGGADKALALGLEVDAVVGDLDSLSAEGRASLGAHRLYQSPDLDTTDLQKAVLHALDRGCTTVDVVGAAGGRVDHAIANFSILTLYRGRGALRIVDDRFEVSLVEGEALVEGRAGTIVSLVAIGQCEGVTTHGLRWDLEDYPLAFSPYGVHNEIVASPASVAVRSGDLLLFKGRWVEKHQ